MSLFLIYVTNMFALKNKKEEFLNISVLKKYVHKLMWVFSLIELYTPCSILTETVK